MKEPLSEASLDVLFREARTHNSWAEDSLSHAQLKHIYDLMKWGATSANCSPARFVFVMSKEGKERLKPHLMEGNIAKTMAAPACVIIAHDMKFYDSLPELFPHNPEARGWFSEDKAVAEETAMRNGTLQGAYLMLAARALGFDCGPMSGYNSETLDQEFFAGTSVKSNFLCNLGVGTEAGLFPRSPRLPFEKACQIV